MMHASAAVGSGGDLWGSRMPSGERFACGPGWGAERYVGSQIGVEQLNPTHLRSGVKSCATPVTEIASRQSRPASCGDCRFWRPAAYPPPQNLRPLARDGQPVYAI